jgi:uncharacterized protein YbjT (DUF2867 family)
MKIVVIGGTGLIGSKVVDRLKGQGHEALAASLDTGVNTLTRQGLADAMHGATVVVDVSNAPSFDDAPALKFFFTSTSNLLDAEAQAGVKHHVALSVVGTDRLQASGYFRAKMAQETLIKASPSAYSIVRATQFYEFIARIADSSTVDNEVRLPPVLIQPMAADDVAAAVANVAMGSAVNGIVEIGGPQEIRLDELVRQVLRARNDPRSVVTDPHAAYYGITDLSERALVAGGDAHLASTRLDEWLNRARRAAA